jgi:hypothetical protein
MAPSPLGSRYPWGVLCRPVPVPAPQCLVLRHSSLAPLRLQPTSRQQLHAPAPATPPPVRTAPAGNPHQRCAGGGGSCAGRARLCPVPQWGTQRRSRTPCGAASVGSPLRNESRQTTTNQTTTSNVVKQTIITNYHETCITPLVAPTTLAPQHLPPARLHVSLNFFVPPPVVVRITSGPRPQVLYRMRAPA